MKAMKISILSVVILLVNFSVKATVFLPGFCKCKICEPKDNSKEYGKKQKHKKNGAARVVFLKWDNTTKNIKIMNHMNF